MKNFLVFMLIFVLCTSCKKNNKEVNVEGAENEVDVQDVIDKFTTSVNASNCSHEIQRSYLDRIEQLKKYYSDRELISRINEMTRLINEVGC